MHSQLTCFEELKVYILNCYVFYEIFIYIKKIPLSREVLSVCFAKNYALSLQSNDNEVSSVNKFES